MVLTVRTRRPFLRAHGAIDTPNAGASRNSSDEDVLVDKLRRNISVGGRVAIKPMFYSRILSLPARRGRPSGMTTARTLQRLVIAEAFVQGEPSQNVRRDFFCINEMNPFVERQVGRALRRTRFEDAPGLCVGEFDASGQREPGSFRRSTSLVPCLS